jgi:hypothetical protein
MSKSLQVVVFCNLESSIHQVEDAVCDKVAVDAGVLRNYCWTFLPSARRLKTPLLYKHLIMAIMTSCRVCSELHITLCSKFSAGGASDQNLSFSY